MNKIQNWLYGLGSGVISGGVNAALAQLGLAGASAAGVQVHILNWKELGIVALTGGLVGAMLFLRQSPLPPPSTGNTETFNKPLTPSKP